MMKKLHSALSLLIFIAMLTTVTIFLFEMSPTNETIPPLENTVEKKKPDIVIFCCEEIVVNYDTVNEKDVVYLAIAAKIACKCEKEQEVE